MIIGVILGVFLSFLLASSHFVAYNLGKKSRKTVTKEEISEEEKIKIKKINEGFQNMMNYDVNVALGKEK